MKTKSRGPAPRHKLTMNEVERQVQEALAAGPRRLPRSWFDHGVAERMSEWIKAKARYERWEKNQ